MAWIRGGNDENLIIGDFSAIWTEDNHLRGGTTHSGDVGITLATLESSEGAKEILNHIVEWIRNGASGVYELTNAKEEQSCTG
jgi:hypothetical protein